MWELVKAMSVSPGLPRPVREVAILVTGAKFHSAYELYAHVLAAELRGLPDEKISTIVAGQRPSDLTRMRPSPTTSPRTWLRAACCPR